MKKLKLMALAVAVLAVLWAGCSKKDDDNPIFTDPEVLSCSTISENLTLIDRGTTPDYIIPCRITVSAKLTIEPGVEIVFGQDGGLEFNSSGTIDAQGTFEKPILMRGEDSAPGYWRGVRFSNSGNSNKMHFVTVDGAGGLSWDGANIKSNISLSGGSKLELKNSTISNSASDGLHVASLNGIAGALEGCDGNNFSGNKGIALRVLGFQVKDLGFNTFSNNGKDKVEVHTARLSRGINDSQSWTNPGAPILLNDRLDIGNNSQGNLTIGEGVIIEMGADQSISVFGQGYLKINGTASNPVIIKGEEDLKDYWKGIYIQSNNANNVFDFAHISGGGSSSHDGNPARECVRIGSNFSGPYRLTMNNCIVSNSTQCGVRLSANTNIGTFTDNNTVFQDLGENICNF
jgi:hypothetical protein